MDVSASRATTYPTEKEPYWFEVRGHTVVFSFQGNLIQLFLKTKFLTLFDMFSQWYTRIQGNLIWMYQLSEVEPLLDTFPDRRPPDPDLLNDAGCTCDDCDLPHHVSTPDEVRHLVGVVKDFLLQNPKPAVITIARSSRDDYCPPEDVNFIQECVLQMLEEVYGSIDVSRDYETDNSEEEAAEGASA
ncbi:UPF0489 protein C5orf22 [Araneus ventricosus]|uniref:UPF0489 protein C5orf22 n=1 Tax=Araneus ventricosus TaxID=182803 RepID=A0A4Y2BEP7_ARAVE|nr:UPF0489 protein C5orf22 [Araneus ventricosus]